MGQVFIVSPNQGSGGGGAPTGAAGGDLAGTYPNPTIGANKVTTAKIADANVTFAKLATDVLSAFDAAGLAAAALTSAQSYTNTNAVLKSLVTTAGDLLVASGAGAVTRLGIGATGTFPFVSDAATGTLAYTVLPVLPRTDAATSSALPAYTVSGATLTANANGAFGTINGVTAALNNRYLVLNGASAVDNGLYMLTQVGDGSTPWILTRHSRLPIGASAAGMFAEIRGGTQAGYVYYCSSAPGSDVVGTNSLTWSLIRTQLTTEQDALYPKLASANAFTAAQTVAVDDATQGGITDVLTLRHTYNAGAGGTNIGAGLVLSAENASSANVDIARFGALLTTATGGSEVSAAVIYARTGGALVEYMRVHGSGAVSFGNTTDQGSKGGLIFGNGVNNATQTLQAFVNSTALNVVTLNGTTGVTTFGNSSFTTRLISSGNVSLGAASTNYATFSSTLLFLGVQDGTATPSSYTVRSNNAAGTNIAGSTLTLQGGLGTGTGAVGGVTIAAGELVGSGTGAHSLVTLAQFLDSDADNDTALLVRVRRSGVETVSRVTIGAADSGGSGFKLLRVAN